MISDKIKGHEVKEFSLTPDFTGKTMNIEIVNSCNESCIYCYFSARGHHKMSGVIDEEFFYRITAEAKELGITDIGLYITGEPFLNPKLSNYVYYLKKELQFKYVYLSTNGILCTPENLKKIADAGIDSIKFSVSSANRENFQKHHGVDAFERVRENIEFAYNYRKENNLNYKLYMFSIITRYNQQEKEEIQDLYGKYVDEIIFSNVISSPYVLGVEEYLKVIGDDSNMAIGGTTLPCTQLFDRIVVSAEGHLCVCCGETRTGYTWVEDLNKISLKEAVYGPKMQELRKMHIEKKIKGTICENCISGRNDNIIKPFMEGLTLPDKVDTVDISDKIKERFIQE